MFAGDLGLSPSGVTSSDLSLRYHVQWKDVNISRGEDNMTSLPAPVALVSSGAAQNS